MNDEFKLNISVYTNPNKPLSNEQFAMLDKQGISLMTWDRYFENAYLYEELGPALSNQVLELLIQYIKSLSSKSLLISESFNGVIPTALLKEGAIEKATCLDDMYGTYEKAKWLTNGLNVNWIGNWEIETLSFIEDKFDITIYLSWFLYDEISNWKLRDDDKLKGHGNISETFITILQSLLCLTPNGEGIFVLPNNFLWIKNNKFLKLLSYYKFNIHCIMELPPDTYKPETKSPMSIFFISRSKCETSLIKHFEPDEMDFETIIQEIHEHKNGKRDFSGDEVETGDFRSWKHHIFNKELAETAKQNDTKFVLLRHIAKGIKRGNYRKEQGGFTVSPNTIYLPLLGYSQAVTKLSDLIIKPQNYFQIILDESQAVAEYVAGYFNTAVGLRARKLLETGSLIRKITKLNIHVAPVLLPSTEKQLNILNLTNDIQNIRLDLESTQNKLWSNPKQYKTIMKEIRNFDRQSVEMMNDWIESLPFPLASILRRYKSTSETRDKVDHLLHFFEAYAQFNTTLLLSIYYQDDEIFQANKNGWINPENAFCRNKRASFGNWVTIGERIAKFTRIQISDQKKRNKILDLFHTENLSFINLISNKEIYKVLKNTNLYRNDWIGHGGICNETEYTHRLALLERELTTVRELVKDNFTDFLLVQPKTMVFSKGIFKNTVRKIMGSNTSYEEIKVKTNIALDEKELYFIEKYRNDPLLLLRFFRMLPSPTTEQNACYFYSRFDGQGIRYVSYHFENQSEQEVEDDGLVIFFNKLSG
ncbi:MAG: hypothetical protein ACTSQ8_24970 [Candidatus Helarchaeota archaeon]